MKNNIKSIISLVLTLTVLTCCFSCTRYSVNAQVVQKTNLPTLYITLDGGVKQEQITKEENLPATFSMVATGYDTIENAPITIKGRGNSTWLLPKKPYQIKFTEKTDILGMGAAKKWILLANYWDKTLMRNYATYMLAQKMSGGKYFTPECQFVDVVINGVYRGNYLLSEKVELDDERINEKKKNGGVLFEMEKKYRHPDTPCTSCFTTSYKRVHVMIKDPDVGDTFTQTEMDALKSDCKSWMTTAERSMSKGYSNYSHFIDVDSFIDWYILNELAKNYDAAFVTSSYAFRSEDGILHMGPVWDVDVCYGNQDVFYENGSKDNGLYPETYRAANNPWLTMLMKDETFMKLLSERWQELNDDGYINYMLDLIDKTQIYLAQSQALEQEVWPDAMALTSVRDMGHNIGVPNYFTFEEEIEYFKNYILRRREWLNTMWTPGIEFEAATAAYDSRIDMTDARITASREGIEDSMENNLFDLSTVTEYFTLFDSLPVDFTVELAEPKKIETYALGVSYVSGSSPLEWTLSGSVDGKDFTSLDTRTGGLSHKLDCSGFNISTPAEYKYYKLSINKTENDDDGILRLTELILGTIANKKVAALNNDLKNFASADLNELTTENRLTADDLRNRCNTLTEEERGMIPDDSLDILTSAEEKIAAKVAALPQRTKGDVNGDGFVSADDALLVLQCSVNLISLYYEDAAAAIMDGKNQINAFQALMILQKSVGK